MIDLTKFIISNTKYIKILPEKIDEDDCEFCIPCDIEYVDEEKNINIRFGYDDDLSNSCYFISKSGRIKKLINGELIFHDKINHDLGFEWNQSFQMKIKHTDVVKYHCWGNDHKLIRPYFSSWMYNDKYGKVIFEITPFYPWENVKKKDNKDFISYKKFIENYKPTLKIVIPKYRLKKWISQAKKLKKKFKLVT